MLNCLVTFFTKKERKEISKISTHFQIFLAVQASRSKHKLKKISLTYEQIKKIMNRDNEQIKSIEHLQDIIKELATNPLSVYSSNDELVTVSRFIEVKFYTKENRWDFTLNEALIKAHLHMSQNAFRVFKK